MEKEIKLTPSLQTQLKLRAALRRGGQEAALERLKTCIGFSGAEILATGVENIIDDYWDTPEFDLFRGSRCFRLRTTRRGISIFVKNRGARGGSSGVFEREEIEWPVEGEDALRGIFNGFIEQRKLLLPDYVSAEFVQALRVSNERYRFLLKRRSEEYELAIDFFYFSSQRFARTSTGQSEIEVEAMNAAAGEKIGEMARILKQQMKGIKPSRESKYERGVRKLWLQYPEWMLRIFESVDNIAMKWIVSIAAIAGLVVAILALFV